MSDRNKHGTASQCATCGAEGRIDCSPSEDGPEFENWIGQSGGKEVCHKCYVLATSALRSTQKETDDG